MKILLTGGTGYIGSHTAVVLARSGHQIVIYDNLSNSDASVTERIAKITSQKITFVEGDVRDTNLLARTLSIQEINAVIHFAGLKSVRESVGEPIDYYANNVQGTISLLQAMQKCESKTLIFSSSATVYGDPKYLPIDENHPTSATSPYGRSKLHIEEMLMDLATSNSSWRIACLRYFNPIGAHDSGLIGENPNGVPNNLVPYIAQVASGQRAILSVFGNDYTTKDGTGIRDYIHVMDLAEGHAAALIFLSKKTGWHAINLGTGRGYSVLDVVNSFEMAAGRKVPYAVEARRPGDVAACYADPKKARQLMNWTANRTLHDMCLSAWQFQQWAEKNLQQQG